MSNAIKTILADVAVIGAGLTGLNIYWRYNMILYLQYHIGHDTESDLEYVLSYLQHPDQREQSAYETRDRQEVYTDD